MPVHPGGDDDGGVGGQLVQVDPCACMCVFVAVRGAGHRGCDDHRGHQQTACMGGPVCMVVGDARAQAVRNMFGSRRDCKPAAQPFMHQKLAVRPFPSVLSRVLRAW